MPATVWQWSFGAELGGDEPKLARLNPPFASSSYVDSPQRFLPFRRHHDGAARLGGCFGDSGVYDIHIIFGPNLCAQLRRNTDHTRGMREQ
jgi:hypothetical protein